MNRTKIIIILCIILLGIGVSYYFITKSREVSAAMTEDWVVPSNSAGFMKAVAERAFYDDRANLNDEQLKAIQKAIGPIVVALLVDEKGAKKPLQRLVDSGRVAIAELENLDEWLDFQKGTFAYKDMPGWSIMPNHLYKPERVCLKGSSVFAYPYESPYIDDALRSSFSSLVNGTTGTLIKHSIRLASEDKFGTDILNYGIAGDGKIWLFTMRNGGEFGSLLRSPILAKMPFKHPQK